jgi:hypothetical protein
MQNDSNPTEHMTNVCDGYTRARTEADRRLYLRAAVRGCVASADALASGLRLLLAAVSKESDSG